MNAQRPRTGNDTLESVDPHSHPWPRDDELFERYYQNPHALQDAEEEAAADSPSQVTSAQPSTSSSPENSSSNISHARERELREGGNVAGGAGAHHVVGGGRKHTDSGGQHLFRNQPHSSKKNQLLAMGKNLLKRRGPITVITTIVLSFSSILGFFFSSPATLFASVKANITNKRDMTAPARNMRYTRIISAMMTGEKKVESACEKPKSKLCRLVTVSDRMVKRMKAAGIQVETKKHEKSGRHHMISFTVRDSLRREYKITSAASLRQHMRQYPFRAAFNKAYDAARTPFLTSNFKTLLGTRFKISKGPGLDGKNKKDFDKSFRQRLGLDGEPADGDPEKRKKNHEDRKNQVAKHITLGRLEKIQDTGDALAIVCLSYHSLKSVIALAKLTQIASLVRFASVFLTEFDRAIAGESNPEVVRYIGDRLTYSEKDEKTPDGKPNRFYNTTFADSEGLRMLLHGDIINISDDAKKFSVGSGEEMRKLRDPITSIESKIGGVGNWEVVAGLVENITGRPDLKGRKLGQILLTEVCRKITAASSYGDIIDDARCTAQLLKVFAWIQPPPLALAVSAAACVAIKATIAKGLETLLEELFKMIAEYLAKMPLDDETKGIDLGNGLAAGAGLLLQNSAFQNGLVPAKPAQFKEYVSTSSQEYSDYIASRRHEALATPLDTTNQHSFLGSLAMQFHTNKLSQRSLNPITAISNTLTTLPMAARALQTASPQSMAASGVFNRMEAFDEREAKCEDPTLSEEFSGDPFCVPYSYMKTPGLNVDPEELLKYMVDNKFIDPETGEILSVKEESQMNDAEKEAHKKKSDEEKTKEKRNPAILKKFNKFCVSRTLPPGEFDAGGSEDGSITGAIDDAQPGNTDLSVDDENAGKDESEEEMLSGVKQRLNISDWMTGFNCSNPSKEEGTDEYMLAMLSAYTMDERIFEDMEDESDVACEVKEVHVIGDSIAHEYANQNSYNTELTGENRDPRTVLSSLEGKEFENGTHIYLSTGLSINPHDTESARQILEKLGQQDGVSVTLFGVSNQYNNLGKTGSDLNKFLEEEASKHKNITFAGGFDAGEDGIHPKDYSWVPEPSVVCKGSPAGGAVGTDDAKQAAQMLLDSPNVRFQTPDQRAAMEHTAKTGTQINGCGQAVSMSGKLLGLFVEASRHFQITIGSQANGRCNDGWHGQGRAIDVNGIALPGDPPETMVGIGGAPYGKRHADFYRFIDQVAGSSGMFLELGQSNCGIPVSAGELKNSEYIPDTCHHLHIGVEKGH